MKIKNKIVEFYKNLLPNEYKNFSKAKKFFWNAIISFLTFSIFVTIFCQSPFFAEHGINHLSNVFWIVTFVFLIFFDFKLVIDRTIKLAILFAPFLIYLIIASFCGLPSFSGSSFIQPLILTFFISAIFWSFSKLYRKKYLILFLSAYLLGAILLGIIVYITTLRGADISSSIYAYKSKNSTGPILLIACCCAFFVFSQRQIAIQIVKYLLYVFFIVLIALMKCRTVLFVIPVIFLMLLKYKTKSNFAVFIALISLIVTIVTIATVPLFREKILINIIFSGHQNITVDEFFSGRLSSIVENMSEFNKYWLLGTCSSYVDCMPVLIIINFGIFGTLSLLPVVVFPYLIFANNMRYSIDLNNKQIQCLVVTAFSIFLFFEGLVPFGPGSETFIFWFVLLINNERIFGKVPSKAENFTSRIVSRISASSLTYVLSSFLAILSLFLVLVGPVFRSVSSKLTSLLPIDYASVGYVEPKSVSIDGPTQMCVGQKIRFGSSINSSNATDIETRWTAWASNNEVSVDLMTGDVIANKKTNAVSIVSYSSKITSVFSYLPVSIVEPYEFNFDIDKIQLSLDRSTELFVGDSAQLLYDSNYIPSVSLLDFYSSDSKVATINQNGSIKCVGLGNTEIYVKTKTKNPIESKHIILSVVPGSAVDVQKIDLQLENNLFSNIYYDFSVLFNDGASDQRFKLYSDYFQFETVGKQIRFNNYGSATLSVISCGNPTIMKTLSITVHKNDPVELTCHDANWISVGTKKKLNLFVKYESGHELLLDESLLLYSTTDYGKRAWHGKSGLVDDEFTVAAITSGSLKLDYALRDNQDVSVSLSLTCSKYSEKQFLAISYTVGLVSIDIIISVSMAMLLSKKWKKNNILFLISCSLIFVAVFIAGLFIYSHTVFAIVFDLLIFVTFGTLLFIFSKKKISFELFCESFQSYNHENETIDFYEIII